LDFIRQNKNIPESEKSKLLDFLKTVSNVFSGSEFSEIPFPREIMEHDVEFLDSNTKELPAKAFPATGVRLDQLKQEIENLVKQGVLIEGDSPFLSPTFFVTKKPDPGSTASKARMVIDYRRLNALIKPLNFPITPIQNFFNNASRYKIYSALDIRNAFLSIPLTKRASEAMAVVTPFGIYLPQLSMFGLRTSPSVFNRAMHIIFKDCPFISIYMDDLLIGGTTPEELTKNLITCFSILNRNNLKIQLSKSKMYVRTIKILGTIFSPHGKQMDPDKILQIKNFPPIKTLKQLQCFTGMLAYLSSYIPKYSTTMFPIFSCIRPKQDFVLTKEAEQAINTVKDILSTKTILYNIREDLPIYLIADASNVGIGAVLYQIEIFDRTKENLKFLIQKFGYIPETSKETLNLLPGMSPGRNVPVVKNFLSSQISDSKLDSYYLIFSNNTRPEKMESMKDKIVLVYPIEFYSKTFSASQIRSLSSMQKEFCAILLSILHFRPFFEATEFAYLLSDCQGILWV